MFIIPRGPRMGPKGDIGFAFIRPSCRPEPYLRSYCALRVQTFTDYVAYKWLSVHQDILTLTPFQGQRSPLGRFACERDRISTV